jgi:ArsR family transcriptional regulator
MDLSDVFKSLGDPNRLRILSLIATKELCVCMIAEVLGVSQPSVSKHLNRLKYSNIIKCRKISQWCFYSLSDIFRSRCDKLLDFLSNEWEGSEQYQKDLSKLDYLQKTYSCCQQLLIESRTDKK